MDFTTIGTVGSYIKQKNMNFAANYKIQTGQRVMDANGNLQFAKSSMFEDLMKANKKSDSEISSARISSIKQKLMNGKKLSTEEMGYLREKDPSLYKKAKHADDAREELKADLKKAKTKQEARQAITQAMMKASAEATAELAAYKAGLGGGEVSAAGYQAGSEVGGNVAGVENSAENLNAETPSLVSVNEEISADGEEISGAAAEVTKIEIQANQETAEDIQQANAEVAEENFAEKKSADTSPTENNSAEKNSPQDIMEKFLMTIRALEDEWAQFTKSKTFEEMPEDYLKKVEQEKAGKKFKNNYKQLDAPNSKILNAVTAYRNAVKI